VTGRMVTFRDGEFADLKYENFIKFLQLVRLTAVSLCILQV